MKKAKIMLSAITVLALVGGVLAFKAKQPAIVVFGYTSYTTTTTKTGGPPIIAPGCFVPYITNFTTNPVVTVIPYSTTTFVTNVPTDCRALGKATE